MKPPTHPTDNDDISQAALEYHEHPIPGKIGIALTKSNDTQNDLALAYTPGVAVPVQAIEAEPDNVYRYTAKGNLIAVITNGTAVLGLGNVGPLASKPVMEGKAVLFKKLADIDVFDIEVATSTPEDFIQTVVNIAPTFGGINLEDIRAPECFDIEKVLDAQLDIPVFHDDQHGTAIIIAAGLLNALALQGKSLQHVQITCLGAGAAGTASMHLLITLGVPKEHITLVDRSGVIHTERAHLTTHKMALAQRTQKRTLGDAMRDADVFIGVSGANLLTGAMLKSMAPKPIVFALSNPDPEIDPALAYQIRDDLIMATGRSDYPNQVNNVLCFPYMFRGALDVRARYINNAMKIAAVEAISALAHEPIPGEVIKAYPNAKNLSFGPQYILPKPTDPRLRTKVVAAVAKAAIESGAAQQSEGDG